MTRATSSSDPDECISFVFSRFHTWRCRDDHVVCVRGSRYFDVYSPLVKTRYSQVYWTMMPSVPLPDEVVQRFAGKTMVVTGWESDQVIKGTAGEPDQSVPITWACK